MKDMFQGWLLVSACCQHGNSARGQKHAWQQRDAPLLHLFDIHGSNKTVAVFNHRLPREEARCMRIRSDTKVNHVELRQLALVQSEMPAKFAGVTASGVIRWKLRLYSMNMLDLRRTK